MIGVGITVMVYDCAVPVQVLFPETYVGVALTVATTVLVPVLVAVNPGMVAVEPVLVRPMLGVLFVQV